VVLELGAGTCWVSHFLNRYGCKTIAVDVSATALRLGRELFERDPATRWEAEPEFLVYDGHRIPLPDGSCDRIVLVDAFHHLPNPQEILRELARLLPEGGIVAMAEPGAGHSATEAALREVAETGVLENEIILSEVDAMARRAGFTEAALLPCSLTATREIPISGLGGVAESEALLDLWLAVHRGPYYLVLHKGPWVRTTRAPGRLDAGIELVAPSGALHAAAGEALTLRFRVVNRGDTRWLGSAAERPGWTRLGAHLYREGGAPPGELLDFNWLRVALPADLDPGAEAQVEAVLPPLGEPGAYRLVFDLVAEGVTWFAERGSAPLEARLLVEAAASGPPGAAPRD
jgi:SAM-dependent methyltransferase